MRTTSLEGFSGGERFDLYLQFIRPVLRRGSIEGETFELTLHPASLEVDSVEEGKPGGRSQKVVDHGSRAAAACQAASSDPEAPAGKTLK